MKNSRFLLKLALLLVFASSSISASILSSIRDIGLNIAMGSVLSATFDPLCGVERVHNVSSFGQQAAYSSVRPALAGMGMYSILSLFGCKNAAKSSLLAWGSLAAGELCSSAHVLRIANDPTPVQPQAQDESPVRLMLEGVKNYFWPSELPKDVCIRKTEAKFIGSALSLALLAVVFNQSDVSGKKFLNALSF